MSDEKITPLREARWWESRKFWTAVVTSAAAWASAISTGGVTVPLALAASSPLLLWLGVEGVIDSRATK